MVLPRLFDYRQTTNEYRLKKAFTLIELLIVITLFGLSASLITASYLTFERNNRTRDAALNLKNDLRLAQSNALSGKKKDADASGNTQICSDVQLLKGWYVTFTERTDSYTFENNCGAGVSIGTRTKEFAESVTIDDVELDGTPQGGDQTYLILYRPLTNKAFFYQNPTFPLNLDAESPLSISNLTVNIVGSSSTYTVTVNAASGEVNEERI